MIKDDSLAVIVKGFKICFKSTLNVKDSKRDSKGKFSLKDYTNQNTSCGCRLPSHMIIIQTLKEKKVNRTIFKSKRAYKKAMVATWSNSNSS